MSTTMNLVVVIGLVVLAYGGTMLPGRRRPPRTEAAGFGEVSPAGAGVEGVTVTGG
ncbi:MAG: hypothetical protein ACKVWR_08310 [Acidimicrobiales bacterium]